MLQHQQVGQIHDDISKIFLNNIDIFKGLHEFDVQSACGHIFKGNFRSINIHYKKKKGISRLKKKGLIYTETSFRGMS